MTERYINESVFSRLFYEDGPLGIIQLGDYSLLIIVWNLLLLLVPFLVVLLLHRYLVFKKAGGIGKWSILGIGGLIWLFFIPNSAYIITEVRHLLGYCPSEAERDVCVPYAWMIIPYFIYSLVGWVSFVLLLEQMKRFLSALFDLRTGRVFTVVVIPFISLGVLLGLINRFNTWEVVMEPLQILDVMLTYFTDPTYFLNWAVFTVGLYILYFAGTLLFKIRLNFK